MVDNGKVYCSKSYKMMWCDVFMKDAMSQGFGIKDISEYAPGRQFTAIETGQFKEVGTQAEEPVFHYCDNAVDTLMWYWEMFDFVDCGGQKLYFFEIKPLSQKYKSRTPVDPKLWQCGANKIEILKQTTLKQVAMDACKEIEQNRDEIIKRYPNHDMNKYIERIVAQAKE